VNTAARGLRPLKNHSVHDELSVSAKCKEFSERKNYFLKKFFYFEKRSEHFYKRVRNLR